MPLRWPYSPQDCSLGRITHLTPSVSSVRVEKPRDRVLIAIFKTASVVLESSVPGTAQWWRRGTFLSLVVWFRGLN